MTELSLIAKVTLVLLASLAAVRVAARASASLRSLILTAAFCVLLALPVVSLALSSMAVPVPVMPAPMAVREAAPHAQLAIPIGFWLRAVWLAGSLVLFFRIVGAMRRARSMRATAVLWTGRDALVADLARDAGVSRSIETLLRDDARAPLTMGMVRPAIVLPADAQTWAESDLRRALAHEIEHIRRNDWIVHMLARVVCAIYWFHPLVWMVWRRLRLESERACDDGVLRRSDGTAYAEQLLLLARRLNTSSAVGLFMASRTDLATRIAAVIDVVAASRSARTNVVDRDSGRRHAGAAGDRARPGRARVCDAHRKPVRSVRWRSREREAVSGADRRPRVVSGADRPGRPLRLQRAARRHLSAGRTHGFRTGQPRSHSRRASPLSATFRWK